MDVPSTVDGMLPVEVAVMCKANAEMWTVLWGLTTKEQRLKANLATVCCAFREEHWSVAISTFTADTTITGLTYDGVRGAARRGVAWPGLAWRGVAWRGVAWRGVAWRGVAWRGVAWRGVAWRGVAWRGVAWRRVAWRGVAWCGVKRGVTVCSSA